MGNSIIKKEIIEYLKLIKFFNKRFDINSYISKNKSINDDDELLQMYEDIKKEANKALIMKCNDSFKYLISSISSLVRNKNMDNNDKLSIINIVMDKLLRVEEIKGNPYEAIFRNNYIRPFLLTSIGDNKEEVLEKYPFLSGFVEIYEKKIQEKENSNQREVKDENAKYHQVNKELIDRYRAGDKEAKKLLVTENMKLIQKIANGYAAKSPNFSVEELINEGVTGLLIAVDRYNPKISDNFSSYASFWIKQKITLFLKNNYRIVSFPTNKIEMIMYIKRMLSKIEAEFGPSLSNEEKAEILGITLKEFEEFLIYSKDDARLDSVVSSSSNNEESDITLGHLVPSKEDIEKQIIGRIAEENLLEEIKQILTEREFVVIYKRFGFGGTEEKSLDTIAKELKISYHRAKQTQIDALTKITYYLQGDKKALERFTRRKENKSKFLSKRDKLFQGKK